MRFGTYNDDEEIIYLLTTKLKLQVQQIDFPNIISNVTTTKMNFKKPVRLTSFQKTHNFSPL